VAFRIDYVARETAQNLRRNWLLALATIIVAAVSLAALGGAGLIRASFDRAFSKWSDDVSFIVYMNPSATQDQIDSIEKALDQNPQVDSVDYFNRDESFALFQRIFQEDDPEIINTIKPEDLPTSFRVKPKNPNADVVQELAKTFEPKAGVFQVEFPSERVRQVQSGLQRVLTVLFALSIVLIVAASLLIFIAIQTAVFSRRREIEVMRLVGATNWYIRTPFLIEGLVQGLIGGAIAGGSLGILTYFVARDDGWLKGSLFEDFAWTVSDLWGQLALIGGIGVGVGVVSSYLSTLWYLKE